MWRSIEWHGETCYGFRRWCSRLLGGSVRVISRRSSCVVSGCGILLPPLISQLRPRFLAINILVHIVESVSAAYSPCILNMHIDTRVGL